MLADASSRVVGAAPAWSIIALERARRSRPRPRWTRLERAAAATLVPFSITFVCMLLASISVWSWAIASIVGVVGSASAVTLRRSRLGRRWRERAVLDRRDCDAAELKSELASSLAPMQREELQRMEVLVEHVRALPGPFAIPSQHKVASSTLVARLDALIVLYVDSALELERSIAAFGATADDVPDAREPMLNDVSGPLIAPYTRIAQLRVQARERCRRRIARLRGDLSGVGQLVRLVHEQTLAAGLSRDEVTRVLGDILDEAELARQAGEEVESLTSETVTCEIELPAGQRSMPPMVPRPPPQRALPVAS